MTDTVSFKELGSKASRVVALSAEHDKTVATAESCTGGLVAHCLTEVPGSSAVFVSGWVCYSNAAKTHELAVPSSLMDQEGAVSEKVALLLAENARRRAGADFAVSTTGIAGPTGARPGKPVGLMWGAVATPHGSQAKKILVADQDRSATKRAFAAHALDLLHGALASPR